MNDLKKLIGEPESTALEGDLRRSWYYSYIAKAQGMIHDQIPDRDFSTVKVATPSDLREEIFMGVNYKRVVMYLMSNGCEWALKKTHGCTMCGHFAKQTGRDTPISPEEYIQQFEEEFAKIDFESSPLLNLYNNGSFLNDNEISPQARREILKMINANPSIKMLVLETRPEFVTEENIKEISYLIPDKHVGISIGLELKDDFYRTICVNKGFTLKQFEHAANIIQKYLNLRAYVLLKPPFLTEKESIYQAIETINYAFDIGCTTVSLESCTVQDYTLVKYLYEQGLYTPPWLWSILEVVKGSHHSKDQKLIVGLFQFYPSPQTVPNNCEICNERVMEAIQKYNRTLDLNCLNNLDCTCKEEWKESLMETPVPFHERLEPVIKLVSQ